MVVFERTVTFVQEIKDEKLITVRNYKSEDGRSELMSVRLEFPKLYYLTKSGDEKSLEELNHFFECLTEAYFSYLEGSLLAKLEAERAAITEPRQRRRFEPEAVTASCFWTRAELRGGSVISVRMDFLRKQGRRIKLARREAANFFLPESEEGSILISGERMLRWFRFGSRARRIMRRFDGVYATENAKTLRVYKNHTPVSDVKLAYSDFVTDTELSNQTAES